MKTQPVGTVFNSLLSNEHLLPKELCMSPDLEVGESVGPGEVSTAERSGFGAAGTSGFGFALHPKSPVGVFDQD